MDCLSELEGSVAVLLCDEGAEVEQGARIAEVECMKMLYSVHAPCAGRVRFQVSIGQVVSRDQPIASIQQ